MTFGSFTVPPRAHRMETVCPRASSWHGRDKGDAIVPANKDSIYLAETVNLNWNATAGSAAITQLTDAVISPGPDCAI